MARSDEAASFYDAVYEAVQEIPVGKVTSYGHIAKLIGFPQRPRQVGVCLKYLPTDRTLRHHVDNVPWQRVINGRGIISPRSGVAGARDQAEALRAEGVEVTMDAMGVLSVDFAEYGWFPDALPSVKMEDSD